MKWRQRAIRAAWCVDDAHDGSSGSRNRHGRERLPLVEAAFAWRGERPCKTCKGACTQRAALLWRRGFINASTKPRVRSSSRRTASPAPPDIRTAVAQARRVALEAMLLDQPSWQGRHVYDCVHSRCVEHRVFEHTQVRAVHRAAPSNRTAPTPTRETHDTMVHVHPVHPRHDIHPHSDCVVPTRSCHRWPGGGVLDFYESRPRVVCFLSKRIQSKLSAVCRALVSTPTQSVNTRVRQPRRLPRCSPRSFRFSRRPLLRGRSGGLFLRLPGGDPLHQRLLRRA